MRKTENSKFTIESKVIQSKDLSTVRKQLPEIMEGDSDIIVIAGQQGIGKTYAATEFMKKNPNSIFLTARHNLLDELEHMFNTENYECKHWFGVSHNRSRCDKKEEVKFRFLKSLGFTVPFLCSNVYKCNVCPHREQFKAMERILAPINYLNTTYLTTDEDKSRFATNIVDESITSVMDFPFDIEYLMQVIQPLYIFGTPEFHEELNTLLVDKDLEKLETKK